LLLINNQTKIDKIMSEQTLGLNLTKGEKIDLTKSNPGLVAFCFGLGWDTNKGTAGAFDLDAFALCLDENKKLIEGGKGVVYFKQLSSLGVSHSGDNLTGDGDGDDEAITLDISKVDPRVKEVLLCVNIYDAANRRQNFGMVNNAYVRVCDKQNGTTLKDPTSQKELRFDLSEDYSAFNGMIMAKAYLRNGEWKLEAVGEGKNGGIDAIATGYF
jgi:tellurium resistance protein TerD